MKHSIDTQASDVYDKKTHEKQTRAAFEFCERVAVEFDADDRNDKKTEDGTDPPADAVGGDSHSGSDTETDEELQLPLPPPKRRRTAAEAAAPTCSLLSLQPP